MPMLPWDSGRPHALQRQDADAPTRYAVSRLMLLQDSGVFPTFYPVASWPCYQKFLDARFLSLSGTKSQGQAITAVFSVDFR